MADLSIASYYSFSIQLRKTSLDTLALLNRERAGRIIRPALLKTGSLAAELAGAVKIWRANVDQLAINAKLMAYSNLL